MHKNEKLTRISGPLYLQLYDYNDHTDSLSDIFEKKINSNFIYCHGYTNYGKETNRITLVSKKS